MGDAENLEVLERVLDGFNSHDADAIVEYFADDAVFESPGGTEPWGRRFMGREEVRAGFAARFEGIPDVSTATGATSCAGIAASPSGP